MKLIAIVSLVLAIGCGGGGGSDTRPDPVIPGDVVVEIGVFDYFFDPPDLSVPPGTTVVWTLYGEDLHSVTSGDNPTDPEAGLDFDVDLEVPGDQLEVTFDLPGEYPYFCHYHFFSHAMAGLIVVE
jgi:plastocyanin